MDLRRPFLFACSFQLQPQAIAALLSKLFWTFHINGLLQHVTFALLYQSKPPSSAVSQAFLSIDEYYFILPEIILVSLGLESGYAGLALYSPASTFQRRDSLSTILLSSVYYNLGFPFGGE